MRRALHGLWRMRPMVSADVPRVMEIEREAFTNPWSEAMVRKELTQDWSHVLVVETETPGGPRLDGFAIVWLVADELHVLNVAVEASARRSGLGRALMEEVLHLARRHQCRLATLEVRRSNEAALALYRALGFRVVGMRPAYYQDDREDAVVMILDL